MKIRNLCATILAVVAFAAFSGAAQAELVGYWSFNGNTNDQSTYNNNGTPSNASYSSNVPSQIAGHISQSLSFNGASTDVIVPVGPTSPLNINDAITISYWMKAEAGQTGPYRRTFGNISGGGHGFEFQEDDTSSGMSLRIDTSTGTNQLRGIGSAYDTNWHHIAITADSTGAVSTWFDGVKSTSSFNYGTGFGSATDIRFGNSQQEASDWFKGLLADAAIWHGTLTDLQITALASGSATPLTVSAVPEPSAVALLASGLIGLLACGWRKRK